MGIYTPNSPYPFVIKPQSPNPRIRRQEDATLARYGDLRSLIKSGNPIDITSSQIYQLSTTGLLSPGARYRIVDYKSVNWLHGFWNAWNNASPTYIPAFTPYAPVNTNLGTGAGAGAVVSIAQDTISTGVYVGGGFSNINGNDPTYFQKLNADGTPNTVFNNNYYDGLSVSPGFNSDIRTIAVQADGKVLVGGNFTSLNATVRNYLVRFNANGTLDTAFYANLGTGFDNDVYTIAVQSDGKILVGGGFSDLNGNVRNGLVRLNANGTEDTTFATNIGTAAGLTNAVQKVLISQTGKIYVLGTFASWNGTLSRSIARLNANGTFDNTFVSGLASAKSFYFIHELTNGDLLLSGLTPGVDTWAGNPIASYVYSVSPTGVLLNNSWGNITTDIVYTATTLSTNEVIISGSKNTDCDGYPVIAVYSEAGVKNTVYDPLVSFSSDVFSLAVMGNDEYLMCGGSFGLTYRTNPNPQTLIALNLSTVGPYQARAVHVSDPEVIVVTAISGSEVDPMGYSETYGDAVTYIPYFNTWGLPTDFDNGTTLPNGQVLSGFDLQWDSAQNVAYCTMPADYPVRFGNYFLIEFQTTLPSPNDYFYAVIEPVKPGVNYSMEYYASNLKSEVVVSPDGLTVKFPNITFAQYQAYDPDTLYAETIEKFSDAYGFVQWRKDYSHNIEAPFDWRNYKYRRYEIDMSAINPAFGGTYYAATTDSLGATGNYIDVPSFGTYQSLFNDGVDPVVNPNGYSYSAYNVVFRGTPGATGYWYYLGSIDNFWCPYMYELDINSNYISNATIYSNFGTVTADNLSSFTDCIISSMYNSTISAGIAIICPGNITGCTFGTRAYYGMQMLSANNTNFSIGNNFLSGDKTGIGLSSGYTKSIVYATDNLYYLVENDGTGFVNTPY